jgi:PleD family two-component response regulator
MPHVSGFELCQIVRSTLRWGDLPVLFLTMHLDISKVQQAISVGGDDYVSKAIGAKELVTCILNRLERSRLLRLLTPTPAYE